MGTAITSLIALFLTIGTTMAAVNIVMNTGSDRAEALAVSNEQLIAKIESSVALVSATETSSEGVSYIDIVITNDGRRALNSFDDWDVIVRYIEASANPIVDTFVFDADRGKEVSIIHVSGDIYAIAYAGDGDDGWIVTLDISSNGQVNSIVDSYEFDTVKGKGHHIRHVDGDIYAVAYSGDGDDGWIKTLEISTSGTITKSVVDSWEYDVDKGKTPFLFQLATGIWCVAFSGDGDDGWLATLTISDAGAIGSSFIDSWEFDPVKGKEIEVINISGDVYALGYGGDTDDGWIMTVDIATDGTITKSAIDSWEFDPVKGKGLDMIQVQGDVYAVAYSGDGDGGWLFTLDIATNGTITKSFIDSFEYEPDKAKNPQIVFRGDIYGGFGIYVISYSGPDDHGFAATFSISNAGAIGTAAIDTLEFDTAKGKFTKILWIAGNIFIVAYSSDGDIGKIITLDIQANGFFHFPSDSILVVPYASTEIDNTWTDQSIWLDYDNSIAELIEPGHLNQHEEMVMRIQLNPEVEASTSIEVTIVTPTGQTLTIYFDA